MMIFIGIFAGILILVYFVPKLSLNLHFNIYFTDSISASANETTSNTKFSQLVAISQADSIAANEIIPEISGIPVLENLVYFNVFIRKVYQRFAIEVKEKPHAMNLVIQKLVRPTITIILSPNLSCDINMIEKFIKKIGHPTSRILQLPKLQSAPAGAIWEVMKYQNSYIILFDYMGFPKTEQARNLRSFNLNGNENWIADHPTNGTNDCYTKIGLIGNCLIANNFASYQCKINPTTGKITQAIFTK